MSSRFSHKLTNGFLAVALPLLLGTIGNLNDAGSRFLSKCLAFVVWVFYRRGRKLIKANLKTAFPEKSSDEIHVIAKRCLLNTIWNGVDFVRLLKHPERLGDFIVSSTPKSELPSQYIMCLPHLGSWEMLAQGSPLVAGTCSAVAERFPYPKLNEILDRSREVNGLKIISREGAVRESMRVLRSGETIGLLIDQNLSPKKGGIFVRFFGLYVPCTPLPAILYSRYKTPVTTGACIRRPDGKFSIVMKTLELPDTDDRWELTQAILASNEELIREYPDQYTWMYHRWVYIPNDLPAEEQAKYPWYARNRKYPLK